MYLFTRLPLLALSMLIVSCGGGSSSNDSETTETQVQVVAITAQNSQTVSETALINTFNGSMIGMSEIFTGVIIDANETRNVKSFLTVDEIKELLDRALKTDNQFTGVVTRNVESCDVSGSTLFNISLASQTRVSDNDYLEVVSDNCVDYDGINTSGTMRLTFSDAGNFNFINDVFNVTIDVSITDFITVVDGISVALDGSYLMDIESTYDGYTTTITSDNMETSLLNYRQVVSNLNITEQYDNSSSTYTINASNTVFDSGLNGSITVSTVTPFEFFYSLDNSPLEGSLKVMGAGNSKVKIEVQNSSTVDVSLDADGDNVYETTTSHSWNDFM